MDVVASLLDVASAPWCCNRMTGVCRAHDVRRALSHDKPSVWVTCILLGGVGVKGGEFRSYGVVGGSKCRDKGVK